MNRAQHLRHQMFARHSHPVSSWFRLVTTPLVVALVRDSILPTSTDPP